MRQTAPTAEQEEEMRKAAEPSATDEAADPYGDNALDASEPTPVNRKRPPVAPPVAPVAEDVIPPPAIKTKLDLTKWLIKVQGGKMYLPVPARLVAFRLDHPDWSIEVSPIKIDFLGENVQNRPYAIMKCAIKDDTGRIVATGIKTEDLKGFGDFVEKAETGACGRALAILGYGTEYTQDFEETTQAKMDANPNGQRIVDSPKQYASNGNNSNGNNSRQGEDYQNQGNGGGYNQSPNGNSRPQEARSAAPNGGGYNGAANGNGGAQRPQNTSPQASQDDGEFGNCVNCNAAMKSQKQADFVQSKFGQLLCPRCQPQQANRN